AEWTGSVPANLKLRSREGKYILKRALESRLPRDVLYRPKQGFAVPLAEWFRGPLQNSVRTALSGGALRETGWFDGRFISTAFDQHVAGLRDHSRLIWSLLMFDAFLRDVHQGEGASTSDAALAPEPAA